MSSATLALSLVGGVATAFSPLNRCAVASSSAYTTKSSLVIPKKFHVFPSSSSTAAGPSDTMIITPQLPLRRCCCYSTAYVSILMAGRGRRSSVALRSTCSAPSSFTGEGRRTASRDKDWSKC